MIIQDDVLVRMWAPRARFALQRTPEYRHSIVPWAVPIGQLAEADGLYLDPDAQALLPMPVRVPHHQLCAVGVDGGWSAEYADLAGAGAVDATMPTLTWSKGAGHTMTACRFRPAWSTLTGPLGLFLFPATYAGADTGIAQIDAAVDAQALQVRVEYKAQPPKSLAAGAAGGTSATPGTPCVVSAMAAVGTGGYRRWYRVRQMPGGDAEISRRDGEAGAWTILQHAPRVDGAGYSASTESHTGGEDDLALDVEFRLIGGRMGIRIGGGRESYGWDEARVDGDLDPIWTISAVRVEAQKFLAATVRARPVWWRRTSVVETAPEQIGFAAGTFGGLEARWAGTEAAGWTATLDLPNSGVAGPEVWLRATVQGPNDGTWQGVEYSQKARGVRSLDLTWAGTTSSTPADPVLLLPSAAVVSHRFDPGSLQIRSSVRLTFPGGKPQALPGGETGTWAWWAVNRGQHALEIWGNRTSPLTGAWGTPARLFSGYGGVAAEVTGSEGQIVASLEGASREIQLQAPRWALPWMDGWNVFYAMAFLAQLGGVAAADLDFAASVPAGPFVDSLDEDGLPAYFLPVGPSGGPLTRPSGQPLWSVMARIAYSIGYLLAFGRDGKLQFRKFRMPAGTLRSFYESDWQSQAQPGGGAEGMWDVRIAKDMGEVRDRLLVIGPDPFNLRRATWSAAADAGVVDTPLAANHLGYPSPAVWMDTQFQSQEFADDAVAGLFPLLRMPSLQVSLTTWFQPDVAPLDVIQIESARLGISGTRLLVVGVTHAIAKGQPARTTIVGRWFEPPEGP